MTATQPELNFTTPSERGVRAGLAVSAEAVQALCAVLADGLWHTAREMADHGLNDRELRVIVEHQPDLCITGNKGYRLLERAELEEIRLAGDRLESQAKKMLARVVSLRRAAHRRLHTISP